METPSCKEQSLDLAEVLLNLNKDYIITLYSYIERSPGQLYITIELAVNNLFAHIQAK